MCHNDVGQGVDYFAAGRPFLTLTLAALAARLHFSFWR